MKYINHILGLVFGLFFGHLLRMFVVALRTEVVTVQEINEYYAGKYLFLVAIGVLISWSLIGLWKSSFFTALSKGFMLLSFGAFLNYILFLLILENTKMSLVNSMAKGEEESLSVNPFMFLTDQASEISGFKFLMISFFALAALFGVISFFKNSVIIINRKN